MLFVKTSIFTLAILAVCSLGFGIGALYLSVPYYFFCPVFSLLLILMITNLKVFFSSHRGVKIVSLFFASISIPGVFFETSRSGAKVWYGYGEFPNVFPHLYSRFLFLLLGCVIFFRFYFYLVDRWEPKDRTVRIILYPLIAVYSAMFGPIWFSFTPLFDLNTEFLVHRTDLELLLIGFVLDSAELISFTLCVPLFCFALTTLLAIPVSFVERSDTEMYFILPVFFSLCYSSFLFFCFFEFSQFAYTPERLAYPEFVPHANQTCIGVTLLLTLGYLLFNLFSLYGKEIYLNISEDYDTQEAFGFFLGFWLLVLSFAIFISFGQLHSLFTSYYLYSLDWPPANPLFSSTYPRLTYVVQRSGLLIVNFSVFPVTELSILAAVLLGTVYGFLSVPLKLNALVWDRRVFILLHAVLFFFCAFVY